MDMRKLQCYRGYIIKAGTSGKTPVNENVIGEILKGRTSGARVTPKRIVAFSFENKGLELSFQGKIDDIISTGRGLIDNLLSGKIIDNLELEPAHENIA